MPTTPPKPIPGRKPKARRRFQRFGEFLKAARKRHAASQQKALKVLAQSGLKVSQSWVAQLEVGGITDPDPDILRRLEKSYGIDYDRIVYELIRDKYALDDLSQVTPVSRERWRAVAALLRSSSSVGRVEGLEIDQLVAKGEMLAAEVLHVPGLANWQKEFPRLKELWIVASKFQDDRNAALREAVIHNLGRGVRYFYLIPKSDLDEGRPFWLFLRRLVQEHPTLRNRVQKQIQGIGLEESDLRWIFTDLLIANPTDAESRTGFIGLRHDQVVRFACRMSDLDVEAAVHGIMPFLTKRTKTA